jgi:DNA-binding NtrC family response regulator
VVFVQGVRKQVQKSILVIDADKKQSREFCNLLKSCDYEATPVYSIDHLVENIEKSGCRAIFWDIDTLPADNRTVRELTLTFPDVYFFCISSKRFHPELKDAICYHIYACLNRPIDQDELHYWLRSIEENESNANGL